MSHRKLTNRMLWPSVGTVKWTHQQLRGSQDIQVQTLDPGVVDPHFSVDPWALNTDQHPEVRGQPGGICRGWVGAQKQQAVPSHPQNVISRLKKQQSEWDELTICWQTNLEKNSGKFLQLWAEMCLDHRSTWGSWVNTFGNIVNVEYIIDKKNCMLLI